MSDTIAAVATASGVASIAIVRISGEKALNISSKLLRDGGLTNRVATLRSVYGTDGSLIDRAIVIYFRAPNSFTGEDIVEFQCHGGIVVAEEILESVITHGARLAEPGEFSKRAFLNGKIDMSEAEAIAGLIEAKSLDAAKILARHLKGELKEFVEDCRNRLLEALSHSEVMIDYAEEDIPADLRERLLEDLVDLRERMDRIVDGSRRRKGLIEGFRVSIVGKPNVGKSSLLNSMLQYDRAIVSDIAGTTRDTIEESVRIGSHLVRIVDTAGIRNGSRDSIEKIGIERSMKSMEDSDIVIALFDASRPADDEDLKIVEMIRNLKDKRIIAVLNKIDMDIHFDETLIDDISPLRVSVDMDSSPVVNEIERILNETGAADELMLSSARQMEALKRCSTEIAESESPLRRGELEFFSYHIMEALKAIGSITRPYDEEEILDRMFGEFCLGK